MLSLATVQEEFNVFCFCRILSINIWHKPHGVQPPLFLMFLDASASCSYLRKTTDLLETEVFILFCSRTSLSSCFACMSNKCLSVCLAVYGTQPKSTCPPCGPRFASNFLSKWVVRVDPFEEQVHVDSVPSLSIYRRHPEMMSFLLL